MLGFLAYELGRAIINRFVRFRAKEGVEPTPELIASRKRILTLGTLLQNLLKYFIFFICGYMILEELVGEKRMLPVLASAGVVGLAIGFGAQSLIKDLVSGFFILFEGQYAVGDVVHLKAGPYEAFGTVEEFGLRTTKIRDFSGNLHYVPNGGIAGVDRYTHGYLSFNLDFTLPSPIEEERVKKALSRFSADLCREYVFLLSPPKVLETIPVPRGRTLVRIRVHTLPSKEEMVEKCAQTVSEELREALKLKEPPPSLIYQISEEALSKYRESILVK